MGGKSRRDFLKLAGLAGAGLVAAPALAVAQSAKAPVDNNELGMLYDATKCVGCKACMPACS